MAGKKKAVKSSSKKETCSCGCGCKCCCGGSKKSK